MKIRLPRSGPRPIPISIQTTGFRYQQQLDEQMKIQELERERIFQQFLKEKEMIDEVLINLFIINAALLVCKVVRKIQRENEAATLTKLLQKKATKEQVI